jgi:thioredoxin-like negative regulator of GroEL
MKFDFLKTKVSVCIIGLIIGLAVGFKIANLQFRNELGAIRRNAVVEAAGRFSNPGNNQNMSPEQINNQVRASIDKAKANPEDVDAQLEAAFQYIQIGQFQDATPFLDQARKSAPSDVRPLLGLGVANMYMGRVDDAIGLAKQARQMEPKNSTVTMVLISFYVESGKNFAEAEKLLRELESSGMDPQKLAEIRSKLDAARSGGASTGSGTGSRSTLDHGPRDQLPGGNR